MNDIGKYFLTDPGLSLDEDRGFHLRKPQGGFVQFLHFFGAQHNFSAFTKCLPELSNLHLSLIALFFERFQFLLKLV